ncbi:MAG: 6-phosphogluconolactonase [Phycisphaeraceae bacterium]|nr:6-phosphogluconolactonase [Phycisphaeraceae bacterium]MCW5762984.1 6-phosphogluconolactonase [Phycisphaeraceae bacterium]
MAQPYDLVPQPESPRLPGKVGVFPGEDELIDAVASDLFVQASTCVRSFGDFHLAISGGSMIEKVCMRLMVDPKFRSMPWSRTQLWIASDPLDLGEPALTATRIVREILLDHAGIPRSQTHVFPVDCALSLEDYQREVCEHLEWRERGHDRLDFIALSLDQDTLYSGLEPVDSIEQGTVVSRFRSAQGLEHAAMTPWFVSAARFVALLAGGAECRDRIASLTQRYASSHDAPGVSLIDGIQCWYIDRNILADGSES